MEKSLRYDDFEKEEAKKKSKLQVFIGRMLLVCFVLCIMAGIASAAVYVYYEKTLTTALDPTAEEQDFIIYPGQTVKGIANKLDNEQLISNALVFRAALKLQSKDTSIEAGEYRLSRAMTMQEIIDALQSGYIAEDTITILEGWRIEDIAAYLSELGYVYSDEFIRLAYEGYFDFDFLTSEQPYGKPEDSSLEGYLFPDTYRLPQNADEEQIISIMLDNFAEKYENTISGYSTDMSLYDVITLASIVEREGRDLGEKKLIAGIYLNRLERDMSLGACPTVLYALGDWRAELTDETLKIDSPYNTRIHTGLPPGPIASPGLEAILAVLEPTETDYLYFLTDKDGIMRYAYTNAEHEYNKATYGISGE